MTFLSMPEQPTVDLKAMGRVLQSTFSNVRSNLTGFPPLPPALLFHSSRPSPGWCGRVGICGLPQLSCCATEAVRQGFFYLICLKELGSHAWISLVQRTRIHIDKEAAKNDVKLGTSQLGVGDTSKPQLHYFLDRMIKGTACNKTPETRLGVIKKTK